MALIPDIHLSGSFVNLNTETGFAVNQNFFIQNKSSKDVIIVRSLTQPVSIENGIHIRPYEEIIFPPTTDYYWGYGLGDVQFLPYILQSSVVGEVSIVEPVQTTSLNLDTSIRYYPALTQPKIQTATITNAESFALLGITYRCVVEINALAANQSVWLRFKAPADRELAIITRRLNSKFSGAEYRLYYDSTGVNLGAAIPAYNMNRRINTPNTASINYLTAAPTSLGTDIGAIMYSGAGASGVGNSTAGTTSREDGFTIYPYNDYFDAKITNLYTSANDIKVVIEFALVPVTIVAP